MHRSACRWCDVSRVVSPRVSHGNTDAVPATERAFRLNSTGTENRFSRSLVIDYRPGASLGEASHTGVRREAELRGGSLRAFTSTRSGTLTPVRRLGLWGD